MTAIYAVLGAAVVATTIFVYLAETREARPKYLPLAVLAVATPLVLLFAGPLATPIAQVHLATVLSVIAAPALAGIAFFAFFPAQPRTRVIAALVVGTFLTVGFPLVALLLHCGLRAGECP